MESRTPQVHLNVPVFVYGYDPTGKPFKEITRTLTINAKAGFVELAAPVATEHPLLLMNMATGRSVSCHARSIHVGPDGKGHVCVVFTVPSPQFWGIEFPPQELHRPTRTHPEREVA